MTFGEKLKNLRISIDKTQGEAAEGIGISRRALQQYETGETIPRFDRIYEQAAAYYHVPVEFLKNESEDDFKKCAEYGYGAKGKKQAEDLANEIAGLFAGGELSEEDADKIMKVMEEAYWEIKIKKKNKDNNT